MGIAFKEEVDKFRAGSIGLGGRDANIIGSRQIETKAKAGLYVHPSAAGKCDLPGAEADVTDNKGGFLTYMPDRRTNADGFEWQVDDYVQYLERGHIVVITEEAVSDGEDVYVRFASGTGIQLGACRNDADTATCGLLPGAHFVGDHTSGLALVSYKK